jgi:small subunit ribosomal protein S17
MEARNTRRARQGYVVSDKMDKTVVVQIEDRKKHPLYGKVVKRYVKFAAHDEKNEAKNGDLVSIMETRPLSRKKHFRLERIIEKAK